MRRDLPVAPGLVIPENELSHTAVRASGPGGQNVNKVSSKVELRFGFQTSSVLSDAVKARLRVLALGRLDAEGRIVVTSQVSRSQAHNLEDARGKLASLVERALRAPKRRRKTRPSLSAKRARLDDKRRQSDKKRARRGPGARAED
jgi:ribosome-associated protein